MGKNKIIIKNVENLYFVGSGNSIPSTTNEKAVESAPRKISNGLFMKCIEFSLMMLCLVGKAGNTEINVLEGEQVEECEVKADVAHFGSRSTLFAAFQVEYERELM